MTDDANIEALKQTGLNIEFDMIDRATTASIEVVVSEEGKLWINLDGKCLLRVAKPLRLMIETPLGTINMENDDNESTSGSALNTEATDASNAGGELLGQPGASGEGDAQSSVSAPSQSQD